MPDNNIIQIENVSKYYKGSAIPALNNISLTISENEICGILGPNGAGKTTLISILCGLFPSSSGGVTLNNLNFNKNRKSLKKIIGVVLQDIALYPSLTAKENLLFFGSVYGLNSGELTKQINECSKILGIDNYLNKRISTFSGGMKRRVNIIAGILHQPKILFLDEPTAGIDVYSKKIIIDYLTEINKKGTTIIYTSHLLNEAELFCTSIVIIDKGEIIEKGKTASLIGGGNKINLESLFLKLTNNN